MLTSELAPIAPKGEPGPAGTPDSAAVTLTDWDREFAALAGMLAARAVLAAREGTRADSWLWLRKALAFYRRRDGQTVGRTAAAGLRDALTERRAATADALAESLAKRRLTVEAWQRRMEAALSAMYVHAFALGAGGVGMMAAAEYRYIDGRLAGEFGNVADLAGRIREGRYSQAQIANFSGNTIRLGAGMWDVGDAHTRGVDYGRLPAYPRDGSAPCQGRCRCMWEHHFDSGNWTGSSWRLGSIEHCRVCLDRALVWNPWRP
jgi:hypothetical protein